jgi:beta-xylosidase
MKIDFSKLEISDIDETKVIIDISKDLGKIMYENSFTDDELLLGKDIYVKKEIDVNKVRAEAIKKYLSSFKAFVRIPLLELLSLAESEDISSI